MGCDCTDSGFLVPGEARVPGGWGMGGSVQESCLRLHIYQEGLSDPRQAPPSLLVKRAGFLRPQGRVPGDGFPESNWRQGEEGEPDEVPLRLPDAPGRGGGRVCPGAQGHRKFKRGGARNKQVSKIARRPAVAPGPSQRRGQRGLDGPVCGRYLPRPQVEPRPQLQVGTCKPGLTLSRLLGARESKGNLVVGEGGKGAPAGR